MALLRSLPNTTLLLLLLLVIISHCEAEIDGSTAVIDPDETEFNYNHWPSTMSLYDVEEDSDEDLADGEDTVAGRRSLFWRGIRRRSRYYISYGVLMANKIPCPPRSGRSYYTHNCYKHKHTANPYTRGCSAITRCRR